MAISLGLGPAEPVVGPVSWEAPASCPRGSWVEARIDELLDGSSWNGFTANGRVEASPDHGWTLTLQIRRPDGSLGQRTVTARRCEELAEAAAFMLAVAVDPSLGGDEPLVPAAPQADRPFVPEPSSGAVDARTPPSTPRPDAADETELRPAETSAQDDPTAVQQDRETRPRLWVVTQGGIDGGAMPGVGGVVELAVGVRWSALQLGVAAFHRFEHRLERDVAAGDIQLTGGSLLARVVFALGPLELGPEAALELGGLRAEGVRGQNLRTRWHLWTALVAGAALGWSPAMAPRVLVLLRTDAVVPLRRWTFDIGNLELGRVGRVGGRGLLGLGFVF